MNLAPLLKEKRRVQALLAKEANYDIAEMERQTHETVKRLEKEMGIKFKYAKIETQRVNKGAQMNIREEICDKIMALPKAKQEFALDFLDFLVLRYGKKTKKGPERLTEKKPVKKKTKPSKPKKNP